jgi:hypothetical protein
MPRNRWLGPTLIVALVLGGLVALHFGGHDLRRWLLALHGIHE